MRFETKAIHSHQKPDSQTGSVVTPLITSTTFVQNSQEDFVYSRVASPTRRVLENCFKELEGGSFALALSSGCACMQLITSLLKPGDKILAEKDLYGGSLRLFHHLKQAQGLETHYVDFTKRDLVSQKIQELQPKILWIETPTNPQLKIINIEEVRQLSSSALLVVDNTFATPYFQKPLSLGADIVFHSATKYIGGHTDVLAGLLVTQNLDLADKLSFLNKTLGPVLSPFDSYLLLRSLKTLGLRMQAHEKNAMALAEFLQTNPRVKEVLYPGLEQHPGHKIAKQQMSGYGGMLSFRLQGGKKEALNFLSKLNIFLVAESLGAVESLAEHPLSMTHASFSSDTLGEDLIRLSAGIEHIEDLKEDLKQALKEKAR